MGFCGANSQTNSHKFKGRKFRLNASLKSVNFVLKNLNFAQIYDIACQKFKEKR